MALKIRIKAEEEHNPEMAVSLFQEGNHIFLQATDHEGTSYVLCEITEKGLELWPYVEGKNWPLVGNGYIAVYDNRDRLLNKVDEDD